MTPRIARALELLPPLTLTTAATALVIALATQTHPAPTAPTRAPIASITPTNPIER